MRAVGSETGGALAVLGVGPLCDAELAEETTAARDSMWVVGNQL